LIIWVAVFSQVSAEEAAGLAASVRKIRGEFERLDQDQNEQLKLDEFLLLRNNRA
jgi:hypothetical protein